MAWADTAYQQPDGKLADLDAIGQDFAFI